MVLVVASLVMSYASLTLGSTITYQTSSGATEASDGNAVDAQAIFTTSLNTLTITLNNLEVDQRTVGQNISDLFFTLGSSATSGSITSSGGNLINVNSGGTTSSAGTASSTGWVLSYSSSTGFHLNGLGTAANTPAYTILGLPGTGGIYDNANSSIAGNGPHNPFLDGSASFTLSILGITADTTVTSAIFSFGTTSGDNVTGNRVPNVSVPDGGATAALLGAAIFSMNLFRRKLFASK